MDIIVRMEKDWSILTQWSMGHSLMVSATNNLKVVREKSHCPHYSCQCVGLSSLNWTSIGWVKLFFFLMVSQELSLKKEKWLCIRQLTTHHNSTETHNPNSPRQRKNKYKINGWVRLVQNWGQWPLTVFKNRQMGHQTFWKLHSLKSLIVFSDCFS